MESGPVWAPPALPPPRTRNRKESIKDAQLSASDELNVKSLSVLACVTEFGLCRTSLCYDLIANKPNPSDEIEMTLFIPSGAVVCGYSLDFSETGDRFMTPASMIERKKQPLLVDRDQVGDAGALVDSLELGTPTSYTIILKGKHNKEGSNSSRRVIIDYLTELETDPSGNRFFYVPANINHETVDFKMGVEVFMASKPEVARPTLSGEQFSAVRMTSQSFGQTTVYSTAITSPAGKNWRIAPGTTSIVLGLPPNVPGPKILFQKSPFKDEEGLVYFCIKDTAPVARPSHFSASKNRIAIFWDASLSRASQDRNEEVSLALALASAFFQLVPDGAVDLYTVREEAAQKLVFTALDLGMLEKTLKSVFYSGATRMDRLRLDPATEQSVRCCVLFSDGCVTLGAQMPPSPSTQTVVPINTVTRKSDHPNDFLLKYYSSVTGGLFFDLDRVNPQQVIDNVLSPPLQSSVLPSTDPIFHIHIEALPAIGKQEAQYVITGRLSKVGNAKLEVACNLEGTCVQTKTYFLDTSSATDSGVVAAAWARMHLGPLLSEPIRLEKNIVDISTKFGIETPLTKIDFLDSTADFVYHDNVAPSAERVHTMQEVLMHRINAAQKRVEVEFSNLFEAEKKWAWLFDFRLGQPKRPSRTQEPLSEKPLTPAPNPISLPNRSSSDKRRVVPWSATSPYFKALLEQTSYDSLKTTFLQMLPHFYEQPAFHYDFAYAMFNSAGPSDRISFGRHILCSILDLGIVVSSDLYRSMAYLLESNGMLDLALEMYDKAHSVNPQSASAKRDLALALSKAGPRFYPRAISLLHGAMVSTMDFKNELNIVATFEWNAICAQAQREGFQLPPEATDKRMDTFRKDTQADIRVCLGWDTANRDIDLFVTEPDGFTVYHAELESPKGGILYQDVQGNYGPEQYLQIEAECGTYTLWTNLPADPNDHPLLGPTTLFLRVFLNWGRPNQKEFTRSVRSLKTAKYLVLGLITVPEATKMAGATFTPGGVMSPPRMAGADGISALKAATSPRFSVAPRQMVQMNRSQTIEASSTFDKSISRGTSAPLLPSVDDFFSKFQSSLALEEEAAPLPTGTPVASSSPPLSASSPRPARPLSQKPAPLVPIAAPPSPTQQLRSHSRSGSASEAPGSSPGITRRPSQTIMTAASSMFSGSPPKGGQPTQSGHSGLGGFGGLGGLGGASPPSVGGGLGGFGSASPPGIGGGLGGSSGLSGAMSSGIGSAIASKSSPALARKMSGPVGSAAKKPQQESPRTEKSGGLGSVVSNSFALQFGGVGEAVASSSSSPSSRSVASPPTSPRSAGLIADSGVEAPRGVSGAAIQYAVESVALNVQPDEAADQQDKCVTM